MRSRRGSKLSQRLRQSEAANGVLQAELRETKKSEEALMERLRSSEAARESLQAEGEKHRKELVNLQAKVTNQRDRLALHAQAHQQQLGLSRTPRAPESEGNLRHHAIIKNTAALFARFALATRIGFPEFMAREANLGEWTVAPRCPSKAELELVSRQFGVNLKRLTRGAQAVYTAQGGARSIDFNIRLERNQTAHSVVALEYGHCLQRHKDGTLSTLNAFTVDFAIDAFFVVFGCPYNAPDSQLRQAGSRTDGERIREGSRPSFQLPPYPFHVPSHWQQRQ